MRNIFLVSNWTFFCERVHHPVSFGISLELSPTVSLCLRGISVVTANAAYALGEPDRSDPDCRGMGTSLLAGYRQE